MNENTATAIEVAVCTACELVPLSVLSLDLEPPIGGWEQSLAARGVELAEDDLGRPSVARSAARALISERREEERARAEEWAERAAARVLVPGGVPAIDGASPFESMAAAGLITPEQEFGAGRVSPHQEFLDRALSEGRQHEAQKREEAKLLKQARRVLEGRPNGEEEKK